MPFRLVYHSQQEPQWKPERPGFGEPDDMICRAVTSVAMLLRRHGNAEPPKTLNQKLKDVLGCAGASPMRGAGMYPRRLSSAWNPLSAHIDGGIAGFEDSIHFGKRHESEDL